MRTVTGGSKGGVHRGGALTKATSREASLKSKLSCALQEERDLIRPSVGMGAPKENKATWEGPEVSEGMAGSRK